MTRSFRHHDLAASSRFYQAACKLSRLITGNAASQTQYYIFSGKAHDCMNFY
jgi:hypothetical protein